MKLCAEHMTKLVGELQRRGCSVDASAVGSNFIHGVKDPVVSASNAIMANAAMWFGPRMMLNKKDGTEPCPICEILSMCKCGKPECRTRSESWLVDAAEDEAINHVGLTSTKVCEA